jgi:hypothetical protein
MQQEKLNHYQIGLIITVYVVETHSPEQALFTGCTRLADISKKINKALPVTCSGGLEGFETSRIPHFLDSSEMAMRLSALGAGHTEAPRKILGSRFC